MAAELTTMMPEEGGYYVWVREALGPFWAVQEAWLSLWNTVMLMAIFPILFVNYLSYFLPQLSSEDAMSQSLSRWLMAAGVIGTAWAVNRRGIRTAGRYAEGGAVFVVGALGALVVAGLAPSSAPALAFGIIHRDLGADHPGALLLGLSIVTLNYGGWDNASTFAGEVERPQRTYPLALGVALVATVLSYLLPLFAGVTATTDPGMWSAEQGWPAIGSLIGGRFLGGLLALAGMVSMWSLYSGQLLFVSRIPYVMASGGWLPRRFAAASAETGAPVVALTWLSVVAALFAAASFGNLTVINTLLYGGSLALEFVALVVLRFRRPDAPRPFRVPWGWMGIGYVCAGPLIVAVALAIAIAKEAGSFAPQLAIVAAVVAAGVALYLSRRRFAR